MARVPEIPATSLRPAAVLDDETRHEREWAETLLEGLSMAHDFVLAVDAEGRILRLHDTIGLGPDHIDSDSLAAWGQETGGSAWPPSSGDGAISRIRDFLLSRANDEEREGVLRFEASLGETTIEFRGFRTGRPTMRVCLGDAASPPGTASPEPAATIDALEKKNAELETCVHSISHDLRSPLVSVLGFARLLREQFSVPLGRTGSHFIDRIEQAGQNMERLLQDMLELSRIEHTPTHPVHVDPLIVLEALAAELKPALDAANVELVLPMQPPIVIFDRTRLYQLFSNLIGNAIRHATPDASCADAREKDRSGHIHVSIERLEDGWEIVIEDDGPGIAREDCERIFGPFQTAATGARAKTAPGRKSSGLGLAIVRKIVESQGGRIRVESELGAGARFIAWLPRIETTSPAAADRDH